MVGGSRSSSRWRLSSISEMGVPASARGPGRRHGGTLPARWRLLAASASFHPRWIWPVRVDPSARSGPWCWGGSGPRRLTCRRSASARDAGAQWRGRMKVVCCVCLLVWCGCGPSAVWRLSPAAGLDAECGAAAAGPTARHMEVPTVECVQPMSRQICVPAGLVHTNFVGRQARVKTHRRLQDALLTGQNARPLEPSPPPQGHLTPARPQGYLMLKIMDASSHWRWV